MEYFPKSKKPCRRVRLDAVTIEIWTSLFCILLKRVATVLCVCFSVLNTIQVFFAFYRQRALKAPGSNFGVRIVFDIFFKTRGISDSKFDLYPRFTFLYPSRNHRVSCILLSSVEEFVDWSR